MFLMNYIFLMCLYKVLDIGGIDPLYRVRQKQVNSCKYMKHRGYSCTITY